MLAVLTLVGILSGAVSLRLAPMLTQTRLNNAARQVATDLQYARTKAISQNRRFRITFRPDTDDYIVEKDEDGSWQYHLLHGHDPQAVTAAPIKLPQEVTIMNINSGGDVIFLPRGSVDGGMTVTLGTTSGGETRQIVINLAGRVRIE
jgi:Tfp pilus assembly protein FimT